MHEFTFFQTCLKLEKHGTKLINLTLKIFIYLQPALLLFFSCTLGISSLQMMELYVLLLMLSLPTLSQADCTAQCLRCAQQISDLDSAVNRLVNYSQFSDLDLFEHGQTKY